MPGDRRALAAKLLADEVRPKPPGARMTPPVAWLLGPEMISAVKRFLLYASYRGELDLHDWMEAAPVELAAPGDAQEMWIDYVSDIGDGQRAMYTTALVLQDDLHVEGALDDVVRARAAAAALPAVGPRQAGWSTLPRGRALIVGGDTAYPLADTTDLEAHVRAPFTWAYRDLVAAGRLVDDDGRPWAEHDLLGIPGNHDYYDQLTGFNRMFRAPLTAEHTTGPRARRPPLRLLGFRRRQQASYFALHLPWGWQLWGIDPGDAGLDYRQEWFFRQQGAPDKLILAMPSPPIAFGRVIADRGLLTALERLGLAAPYAGPVDAPVTLLDGQPPDPDLPRALAPGQCRADLSGDMHHYARYSDDGPYAAIVSGAGGAFHHPSFTDFGEVPARALYPAPARSRRAVAAALFNPRTVFGGGVVNVTAFALALVVAAGSIRPDTRVVTDALLGWLGIDGERVWFTHGPAQPWDTSHWSSLRGAALFTSSIALAGILVVLAIRYAGWVTHNLRRPREDWPWAMRAVRALPGGRVLEENGFLPSWLLVIAAAILPALVGQLVPLPSAAALLFQLLFLSTVVVVVAALLVLAIAGGEYVRRSRRGRFVALGGLHALIQLTMPLLIVRVGLGHPIALVAALAAGVGFAVVARWRLAVGGRSAPWLLVALWLGHWVAMVVLLVWPGDRVAVLPASDGGWALFLVLAGAIGSIVGCLEYGWYLAVAITLNGHNNEVGAAARIPRFRQFIRFRVEPHRLTGFVIAIDEPGDEPAAVVPRVVDVFTVTPTPRDGG
jgi:hypothetical protein